ncbi:LysE family translocator [Chitiniphilus eburneus]|uniref:LysE family translocator n=1 Tax=Chitiniphilus eburneus TaxID=2571148 RepID=A0A4U0PZ44_9NEIS|nr:LysE family translocator [Chitiniphilus eburneus]TJZ73885.1 LysE family translocator [Chitiniphilus eburneus]
MTLATLLLYIVACFAVTVMPGPTMLLALTNGASRNRRVAWMGMLGAALSDLLLIGAVAIGLGAVLAASERLFSLVKWLGALYLLWVALQLWRSPVAALVPMAGGAAGSARRAFTRSLLVALSNPKGLLFFSAFLPQFIDTSAPQAMQYVVLAVVTALLDIAVMAGYALGGAQAARLLSVGWLRGLNRGCAMLLVSLAGILAAYRHASR